MKQIKSNCESPILGFFWQHKCRVICIKLFGKLCELKIVISRLFLVALKVGSFEILKLVAIC